MKMRNTYVCFFFPFSLSPFSCRLFLWLFICPAIPLFACLPTCDSICIFVCSFSSAVCLPIYLFSSSLSIWLAFYTCLSVCLCIYVSIGIPACLPIYLSRSTFTKLHKLLPTHALAHPTSTRPPGAIRAKEPVIVMPPVVESYLWHHRKRLFTPIQSRRPLQLSPAHCNSISIFSLPWIPRTLILVSAAARDAFPPPVPSSRRILRLLIRSC